MIAMRKWRRSGVGPPLIRIPNGRLVRPFFYDASTLLFESRLNVEAAASLHAEHPSADNSLVEHVPRKNLDYVCPRRQFRAEPGGPQVRHRHRVIRELSSIRRMRVLLRDLQCHIVRLARSWIGKYNVEAGVEGSLTNRGRPL